jgi:hypothetical protein
MTLPTDRERAEEAKKRANEQSTRQFDIVGILCPACNEPAAPGDPDPNEYVHKETDGGFTNDRAAFEISPKHILEHGHENPWNEIHVVPEAVEMDGEQELKVIAYKHDHSSEAYQAWKEQLEELETVERRASENQGLGDFV